MSTNINNKGGKKRLKFESLSESLQKSNVDVIHRVVNNIKQPSSSESPLVSCHFLNELEECKVLECSRSFQRLYYVLKPLVQSLPELIHHRLIVCDHLLKQIESCDSAVIVTYLKLITAFARDLGDSFFDQFGSFFSSICKRVCIRNHYISSSCVTNIGNLDSEQITKVFECLSFLIKYQFKKLSDMPHYMIQFYGSILGNDFGPIRDLGAKVFSMLVRNLKTGIFKSHFHRIVNGMMKSWLDSRNTKISTFCLDLTKYPFPEIEASENCFSNDFKSLESSIDGLSKLLFHSCKGIKGYLHSKGGGKLSILLNALIPKKLETLTQITNSDQEIEKIFVVSRVVSECFRRIFRHLYPSNSAELWIRLMVTFDSMVKCIKTSFTIKSDVIDRYIHIMVGLLCEVLYFGLRHSKGRALMDVSVRSVVSDLIVNKSIDFIEAYLEVYCDEPNPLVMNDSIIKLFCQLFLSFHDSLLISSRIEKTDLITRLLNLRTLTTHPIVSISTTLCSILPFKELCTHFVTPMLNYLIVTVESKYDKLTWLDITFNTLNHIYDIRNLKNNDNRIDIPNESELQILKSLCKDNFLQIISSCIHNLTTTSISHSLESNDNIVILSSMILYWFQSIDSELINTHPYIYALQNFISTYIETDFPCYSVTSAYLVQLSCFLITDHSKLQQLLKRYFQSMIVRSDSLCCVWSLLNIIERYKSYFKSQDNIFSNNFTQEDLDSCLKTIGNTLITPSHWLRLALLKVLQYFPNRKLSEIEMKQDTNQKSIIDNCDVVTLCLEVVLLPVQVSSEREIILKLSNLEVVVRSGRLTPPYLLVVSSFCVGLLNIKFSAIWDASITVVQAVVDNNGGEDILWPLILSKINFIVSRPLENVPFFTSRNTSAIEIIQNIFESDDGKRSLSPDISKSILFYINHDDIYHLNDENNSGLVFPDSRTDLDTVYIMVWKILEKCPSITLRRSKIVVPMFFSFLEDHFYRIFNEDSDIPYLSHMGLLKLNEVNKTEGSHDIISNIGTIRKRFEMFLRVFAAVISPKQLFGHQLLYNYFISLLSSPDSKIATLSFQCITNYKNSYITPYKDNLKRMLDDKTLRNELVLFDPSQHGEVIDIQHRPNLMPIIVRIIYGKTLSKSGAAKGKEQSQARRTAILAFLSRLEPNEVRYFVHLTIQSLLPSNKLVENRPMISHQTVGYMSTTELLEIWMPYIENFIQKDMVPQDLEKISWERKVGYLHLLGSAIQISGFVLTPHLDTIAQLVSLIFQHCQVFRNGNNELDEFDELEDETDNQDYGNSYNDAVSQEVVQTVDLNKDTEEYLKIKKANQITKVRNLCLLRFSDLIDQYHKVFSFSTMTHGLLPTLLQLIPSLPHSIGSSTRPPALLRLLHSYSQHSETIENLLTLAPFVEAISACIATRSEPVVLKMVMEILTSLLDLHNGDVLLQHSQLIINSFSRRLVGKDFDCKISELKLSNLSIFPSGSIKLELELICRIAENIFHRTDIRVDIESIAALETLLLAMLRSYTTSRKVRVEESWVMNILRIYKSLLQHMPDVKAHVAFLSRLFGPSSHSQSLFNFQTVRNILLEVYQAYGNHPSTLNIMKLSIHAMSNLLATDKNLVDSRNFDACMPIFHGLSAGSELNLSPESVTWSRILGPDGNHTPRSSSLLCTAVIYECFRCLYDIEMTIRSAALSSIKRLVEEIAVWNSVSASDPTHSVDVGNWIDLMKSAVLPCIHNGLKQNTDAIKRSFILLAGHTIRVFSRVAASSLSTEMKYAVHLCAVSLLHDDPEQDFFENITHIQLHRRVRAMSKLRELFELNKSNEQNLPIQTSTLFHLLLPLAYHPLMSDEFNKKDHLVYVQEAALFLGSICKLLPWTQYHHVLRKLLKYLDKQRSDKEKILLNAVCAVLESFHFDLTGSEEVEGLIEPVLDRHYDHLPANSEEMVEDSENDVIVSMKNIETNSNIEEEEDEQEEGKMQDREILLKDERSVNKAVNMTGNRMGTMLISSQSLFNSSSPGNISKVVVNSIIPWIKVFLLKDVKDHKGNRSKVVRPQVGVALTKLISELKPPVVTESRKIDYFTSLVISVVGTLRSRDASARDAARESLSSMIRIMGMSSLYIVLYELRHMLREGYQRHICNYSIRSILTVVLVDYVTPCDSPYVPIHLDMSPTVSSENVQVVVPDFDKCLPMIMQCVMDDLIGDSRRDFSASQDGTGRVVIRESKGSKANDTLELCARYLLFRPTYALLDTSNHNQKSSIHIVTTPLLEVLRNSEDSALIGRIGEALQRVALGLSRNTSVMPTELLLYLHSILQPFVLKVVKEDLKRKQAIGRTIKNTSSSVADIDIENLDAEEVFGNDFPSYLRDDSSDDEESTLYPKKTSLKDNVTNHQAAVWLSSERLVAIEQRSVIEQRNKEATERNRVLDGASAPKLSGYNRHKRDRPGFSGDSNKGTDPAAIAAVRFCLILLNSSIKNERLRADDETVRIMLTPFIPLLTHCLRLQGAGSITAIALRCLCSLLIWGVTVNKEIPRVLGNQMLRLMFKGGALLTTDKDLVQACLKGLCTLFQTHTHTEDVKNQDESFSGLEQDGSQLVEIPKKVDDELIERTGMMKTRQMPLKESNLRLLIQLLASSITEVTSSNQSAAFQLTRVLVNFRVMLPEIYDLMEQMLDLIVLSHKRGIREAASASVISFLLHYPLGKKRFQTHLKKFIVNCSYEYEEGREAALTSLSHLLRLLPLSVLEECAQMIFLPLVLRLVNDTSKSCRGAASEAILNMCRRVSAELFATFYDYSCKWLGAISQVSDGDDQTNGLIKSGACVASVLVTARPDLLKRSRRIPKWLNLIAQGLRRYSNLKSQDTGEIVLSEIPDLEINDASVYSITYHLLATIEKLYILLPSTVDEAIMNTIKISGEKYSKQISSEDSDESSIIPMIEELLLSQNVLIQEVAARVLNLYLNRRNPATIFDLSSTLSTLATSNALYNTSRKLCIVLNHLSLSTEHLKSIIECLTFSIRAFIMNSELTILNHQTWKKSPEKDENGKENDEDDNSDVGPMTNIQDGVNWIMQRLRGIGTDSRGRRRIQIIKMFHSLTSNVYKKIVERNDNEPIDSEFLTQHLKQIVEVCFRAQRYLHGSDLNCIEETKGAATELLILLERIIDPSKFMEACVLIQQKLDKHKQERKREQKTEYITDSKAYAMRKIAKSKKKKESKKRKNESHAALRGMKRHRS